MIYTKMIAFNLQSMVYLKAHHPAMTTPIIKPLTMQERSRRSALAGEFMGIYQMLDNLMNNKETNIITKHIERIMHKKNKTINAMADISKERTQYPTDFIDNMPVQVSMPDLYQYAYKVRSIDNLISITNHQLHGTQLHNTFFSNHSKVIGQDGKICLPVDSPKIKPDQDIEYLMITTI